MAVSKEELFAKYKQLKAEGVSITLMELKKQMESEASDSPTTSAEKPTGFSALSATQNSQNDIPKQEVEYNQTPTELSQNNSWTTSYSSTSVQEIPQPTISYSYNNQPTNIQTQQALETSNNSVAQQNYLNNFNSNYDYTQTTKSPNIQPQNMFQPVITNEVSTPIIQNDENNLKKFCLVGYPLGHSLSTYIHNAGFKSLGLNATYEILETPPEDLVDRIKYLKSNNFAGFNVTIPLKLPVTLFLDEIDISADVIGAVNTVVINNDKTMKGYNTDVIGFRNAIPQEITLAGKTVGILGTGGAARAAITALAQEQVKQIKIFTRNIPNSLELLNYLREKFPRVEFNAFQIEHIKDLSDINILVNTTPIGMLGRSADLTPVEEKELRTLPQGAIVYDVIYNPKKTVLLKLAEKNGYKTINGVDMFIHQALVAEQIWTGKTPDFKDMKIAALENL